MRLLWKAAGKRRAPEESHRVALNSGLTKDRGLCSQNTSRVMVFIWQSDPEHLSLCSYCKMRIQKAFSAFLWSNRTGSTPRNRQQSEPKNHKTIQIFPWPCCCVIKATLWTPRNSKGFTICC